MTERPHDRSTSSPAPVNRRRALRILGGATLGAVAAACSRGSDDPGTSAGATTGAGGTPAGASADCLLTPEMTEGPFYLDLNKVRSDITEGKPGTPMTLELTVVDVNNDCRPIKDAAVDIWHTDASGQYSGVNNGGGGSSNNETFLRGIQVTDSGGKVSFETIYPGWYRGRTVHIHVKVSTGGRQVHTGQLFFPDDISSAVFEDGAYAARGQADTTNRKDNIFSGGGDRSTVQIAEAGNGYRANLTLGIQAT